MASLTDEVAVGARSAPSRVVFGAHETNLTHERAIGARHVAYYERRAAGGAGVIVCETASVTPDDWPYERAPLAADCEDGWRAVGEACHAHGALVLAGLGHAGAQGSSAFSQAAMWAPSRVADAISREMPAELEQAQIDAILAGFAAGAQSAARAGLDGVEIDAGCFSLLRQFHSGLTNQRGDRYGEDKLALTEEVLRAARSAIGHDAVLALRLSCDELAPWAGVTPEHAAEHAARLAQLVDLVVVVRAGPYSTGAYRPTAVTPQTFNLELCAQVRAAVDGRALVALQGSVVDPAVAQRALEDGAADLVEMTRAQIAEPRLVAHVRAGQPERARPCLLCNQACRVRDGRNPIVSCVGEPRSGYETTDPAEEGTVASGRAVLVIGGGPAGLEAARVLALRGNQVRLIERDARTGGVLRTVGEGLGRSRMVALADWLEAECRRHGVQIDLQTAADPAELASTEAHVILATGSRAQTPAFEGVTTLDPLAILAGGDVADGEILVHDPIGASVGVEVALKLKAAGRSVAILSADQIAATLLSRSGELAEANVRLQQAQVTRELRAKLIGVADGQATLEDVWTGARRSAGCDVLVDCRHRLGADLDGLPDAVRVGDCVAPRTILEAILEGRRAALAVVPALSGVR